MKSELGNKEIMAENIRRFMKRDGLNVKELSSRLGIAYSTVSDWVRAVSYPRIDKIEMMAKLFKVEKKDLVERPDKSNFAFLCVPVPIYSGLSCGNGTWVDESPDDFVGIPSYMIGNGNYFANPAEGDSMEPKLHDGDLLIFEATPSIDSGDIGSFSLNGEYYCKRFKRLSDGSVWLFSENPQYDPIPVAPGDKFRVLGKYRMRITRD